MLHVFIINPAAGTRDRTAELTAEAKRLFDARGLRWTVEPTRRAGHALELAVRYAEAGEPVTLYACGGDGTLGEVARGVSGRSGCRVAPVPIGTGNDFVKCFAADAAGHFRDLSQLLDGVERPVDAMRVGEERISLNIVSAGMDAAVAQNVRRFKRLPLVGGRAAYNLSVACSFFTSVCNRFAFEVDGRPIAPRDYLFAVAANGRYYGGGFHAAPVADIQDGWLDFIRVPSLPRRRLLAMINSYKRGEHLEKYDFIEHIRCRSLRILSERPVALNIDGEIELMSNPEISMLPGAVRLLLPGRYVNKSQKSLLEIGELST